MDRFQAICLCIMAGIIAAAIAFPASAESIPEKETDVSSTASEINFTKILDPGLDLNFRFLTSMLELLDLNLRLINGTLDSRVSDYPFLATPMEGTGSGVRAVDSILVVMGSGPQGVNETNVTENSTMGITTDSTTEITLDSINKSFARINESLESPDSMIEHVNSTLGEPNATTPLLIEMFESIKGMLSLFG